MTVTTLAESGPGSLRDAIEANGARTIVFAVGGEIRLRSELKIRSGQVTVAGQTAPGDGVTLRGHPLVVAADDVVLRFMRVRLGDETGVQTDAVTVERGQRIILDHLSASWSIDETLSVGSRYDPPENGVYDVTVQWCLIGESLNQSGHDKGKHGYGSLIRGGFGARMSFIGNLWANHQARMPRPGNYNGREIDPTGPYIEFVGNVFYNWGGEASGYNADKAQLIAYDFVDNHYLSGPDTKGRLAFCEENSLSRAWFAGNSIDGIKAVDPWSLVGCKPPEGYRESGPVAASGARAPGLEAVLAGAGASRVRDSVDQRIVSGVRDRTGRIIDSQKQVGGWPQLKNATAPADLDRDGMADAWERRNGLDPTNPTDRNGDRDRDGYTNLEEYLNSLI